MRKVAGIVLLPVMLVALVLLGVGTGLTLAYSKVALTKKQRLDIAREAVIKSFIRAATEKK
jgi:hypothetical protein